jgi:pyruvate dehydrogenase E2 component (dihydrolipoamide acetyltransferase)
MPTEIKMPDLGLNVEAGNLSRWLVREGQKVKPGDVLAEIETDKATMEFEATSEGVMAKLLVADGAEQVKVGHVIALLAREGEDLTAAAAGAGNGRAAPAPGASAADIPRAASASASAQPAARENGAHEAGKPRGRIKASPLARRLARAQGIDLSAIQGSGPSGRIVKSDIEKIAARSPAPAAPASIAAPQPATVYGPPADVPHETIKLSNMRKVIARRLAESKATVPHFYLTVDIKLDALLKLRSEFNAALDAKVSVNDLLIKALGLALTQVGDANVQFAGDQLYKFQRADVSVAVAIPGGLVTPVIKDAANKRLVAIATEMKELAARARDGKLAPHEYQGGTASLSNLGMYGIRQFDAVINPPQGLIVAVGAGEKRCIVENDTMQIATVMSATGSFDHRAIDGAIGAQFMAALKRVIEQPFTLLA